MGKWRRLWRRDRLDAAMDAEMRFHIEMEAERLVRERGLDPGEARRQALVAFGGVEKYKEEGRDTRRLAWLDALSLDARLGVRMLVKHRGLTIVGGFAMAVDCRRRGVFRSHLRGARSEPSVEGRQSCRRAAVCDRQSRQPRAQSAARRRRVAAAALVPRCSCAVPGGWRSSTTSSGRSGVTWPGPLQA